MKKINFNNILDLAKITIGLMIAGLLYQINSNIGYNRWGIVSSDETFNVIDKKTGIYYFPHDGNWYRFSDSLKRESDFTDEEIKRVKPPFIER